MLTISAVHTIYWEVASDSSCICCTIINTTLMRPLKIYGNLAKKIGYCVNPVMLHIQNKTKN